MVTSRSLGDPKPHWRVFIQHGWCPPPGCIDGAPFPQAPQPKYSCRSLQPCAIWTELHTIWQGRGWALRRGSLTVLVLSSCRESRRSTGPAAVIFKSRGGVSPVRNLDLTAPSSPRCAEDSSQMCLHCISSQVPSWMSQERKKIKLPRPGRQRPGVTLVITLNAELEVMALPLIRPPGSGSPISSPCHHYGLSYAIYLQPA